MYTNDGKAEEIYRKQSMRAKEQGLKREIKIKE